MDKQKITKAKGKPMLTWVGKKPLEKIERSIPVFKWIPKATARTLGVFLTSSVLLVGAGTIIISNIVQTSTQEPDPTPPPVEVKGIQENKLSTPQEPSPTPEAVGSPTPMPTSMPVSTPKTYTKVEMTQIFEKFYNRLPESEKDWELARDAVESEEVRNEVSKLKPKE